MIAPEKDGWVMRKALSSTLAPLVVLLLASLAFPAWAGAPNQLVGLPAWDRVPSAKGPETPSELRGVQAFSSSNVWTVGHGGSSTLVEHWNGTAFAVVKSPGLQGRDNRLEDVDGIAPDDIWAVGHADRTVSIGSSSLIEHWDGRRWSIVPSPNLGTSGSLNDLTGVAAVAADDAWAVGTFQKTGFGTEYRALVQHWNGAAWSNLKNPCGLGLSDVDARTGSDIWAVGGSDTCHWDGSAWTRFPVGKAPNPQAFVDLIDVAVVAPGDAWGVGEEIIECGEVVCFSGEIQHWNGSAWTHVTNFLPIGYGIDAVSAQDIWAVGPGPSVLHYDGNEWAEVPQGVEIGELWEVKASSASDVWAAGNLLVPTRTTLVEHAPSATSGAVVGGSNVGDATVTWIGPESGSVETDQFGNYQVGGLHAGTYTFVAAYQGCQPASAQIRVLAGQTIGQDFALDC
jgi:hypothetical protein